MICSNRFTNMEDYLRKYTVFSVPNGCSPESGYAQTLLNRNQSFKNNEPLNGGDFHAIITEIVNSPKFSCFTVGDHLRVIHAIVNRVTFDELENVFSRYIASSIASLGEEGGIFLLQKIYDTYIAGAKSSEWVIAEHAFVIKWGHLVQMDVRHETGMYIGIDYEPELPVMALKYKVYEYQQLMSYSLSHPFMAYLANAVYGDGEMGDAIDVMVNNTKYFQKANTYDLIYMIWKLMDIGDRSSAVSMLTLISDETRFLFYKIYLDDLESTPRHARDGTHFYMWDELKHEFLDMFKNYHKILPTFDYSEFNMTDCKLSVWNPIFGELKDPCLSKAKLLNIHGRLLHCWAGDHIRVIWTIINEGGGPDVVNNALFYTSFLDDDVKVEIFRRFVANIQTVINSGKDVGKWMDYATAYCQLYLKKY